MQKQREEHPSESLFIATVMCLLISFRFISLPLLIAGMLLSHCVGRRNRWTIGLRVAFFVSLLSPIDVPALGSYNGGGAHRSGPRLVRCIVGLPARSSLIAHYGEYYSFGCSGYTANSPRWVLVLR